MGLGGVAIATLPSVIFPKLMFSDRLGGAAMGGCVATARRHSLLSLYLTWCEIKN